ncbi:MAG: DegT/DnrJ/EryC1/StrS family aminotransferase [Deltaproteobacteria bacterium]|nr:DegT/DnrJ/EryC1/StrS family aminotransferase [Deltaproteobacteria bacterium]
MLDPRRANNQVQGALEAAFKRCLAHGQFIQGPEVEAFEKQAAAYLGVDHAIGVSSGTDALLVALMALGIGAGDEVICPTYTFFATAGAIWRTGAKPVFCDIKPRCFNIDPEDIARRVTPRTKAIVPVHLFGQAAEMDPILDLARTHGLAVIEDAAQAIGAEYKGRRVGSLGTVGCFSFFPSKNVGGFGDGGLVTTKEGALAARIRALRNHGGMGQYQHTEVGGNFRLDALQAALLAVKLAHADRYTAGRQQNAALYTELFHQAGIGAVDHTGAPCATSCPQGVAYDGVPLILPAACQNRHVFNQYVVRLQSTELRDRLQAALKAKNVGSAIYYPRPMHLQACFAALGYKAGDLPVAEAAAACSLALPIYSELTEDEIRYVVEAVVRFFAAEGVTPIARSAA